MPTNANIYTPAYTPAVAPSRQWCVGSTLRSAREAGSQSLEEIAEILRFRTEYLSALEEENYGVLPGWAYVLGYVRAYAEYLGLEPGPLVKKVREQLAIRQHLFQAERSARRLAPRTMLTGAGIVATLLIAAGIFSLSPANGLGRLLAPVSTSLKLVIAKSADLFAGNGALTPAGARDAATPGSRTDTADTGGQADIWGEVQTLSMVPATKQNRSVIRVYTYPRGAVDRNALEPRAMVLRASRPVALQIEDGTGQIILNREFKAGELYRAFGTNMVITTPDAGAVEIYVNGKPAGTLGSPGQALTRASLKLRAPSS